MELSGVRIGLYWCMLLVSLTLLSLCAARLQYTLDLPPGDKLNKGVNFADPTIVELLVTSCFGLGWCGFMIYIYYFQDTPNSIIKTYREELIVLGVLWGLWTGGTAAATHNWAAVSTCQQFAACRLLSALLGMCWLGFIGLTALIGLNWRLTSERGGMNVPLARRFNPSTEKFSSSIGSV